MEEEIALLQFVALALPAVAILMQAVVRFHDQYFTTGSEATLRIEFRLLEFTFLGLVLAGAVFALTIFLATESVVTKIGIALLSFALLLIVPATWFTFRRAKYPTKSFDSPEELVITGGKTMVKICVIFGIPLALIVGLGQIIDIPSDLFAFAVSNALIIAELLIAFSITIGVLHTATHYYQSKLENSIEEEWRLKLKHEMQNIKNRLDEDAIKTNSDRKYNYSLIEKISANQPDTLNKIMDRLPKEIEEEYEEELDGLKFILVDIRDIVRTINEIETEINYNEFEIEKKINEEDKKYNEEKLQTLKSQRASSIKRLDEKLDQVRNMADTLEEKLEEELDST